MRSTRNSSTAAGRHRDGRPNRNVGLATPLAWVILLSAALICGCAHGDDGTSAKSIYLAANALFAQGNYAAALVQYRALLEKEPETADRVLFEMGVIYAHPANDRRSYPDALACFRNIITAYPDSEYRRDSQMMTLQIQNVILKDKLIAKQQAQIDTYRRGMKSHEGEVRGLREQIASLEREVFELRREPADRVLIEKAKRRLTLISNGEAIKSYTIALGKNQTGPKERRGDNKTPEGSYIIESRNRNSGYHLSLRLSYPNEKDKQRARALGVSPGGDIMIHGLKNGHAWVGGFHTKLDWTEGCIAVTNQEIEEIARLVPDGTPVEIRP